MKPQDHYSPLIRLHPPNVSTCVDNSRPAGIRDCAPGLLLTQPLQVVRSRLLTALVGASLLAAPLLGVTVTQAPAASATTCPSGFNLVSGTTDICERVFTSTGLTTWTVPDDVTSIDVLVVGSGGRGGGTTNQRNPGGGGGGVAVLQGFVVTPGDQYWANLGSGFPTQFGEPSRVPIIEGRYGQNASGGVAGTGGVATVYQSGLTTHLFDGDDGQPANSTAPTSGHLVNHGLFSVGAKSWGGGGGGGTNSAKGTTFTNGTGNSGGGGGGGDNSYNPGARPGEPGIVVIRTQVVITRDLDLTNSSASATNGEAFASPAVVRVTATGTTTPVSGVVVTAAIASSPGGSPSLTGATATTDANGDATFSSLAIRGPTGDYTLTFSASGAASVTSSTITLSAGAAAGAESTITSASAEVGTGQTTAITVQAEDSAGNPLTAGGDTVVLTPSAGSLTSLTDEGDGTYTATFTAPATPGSVTVSGTVNGSAIGTNATITVKSSQIITWAPANTELTMPGANITPSAFAASSGDGTLSYSVHSAGTTGCTLSNAASPTTTPFTLTYTAPGTCTVRVSASGTATYAPATIDVDFTVSLAPQTITAASTSTRLRPGQTATVSSSGSTGSGAITWTNTTAAVCTLTGTTVTADANGTCVLTVDVDADATYAAASDSITITVFTPGSSGGGSGGESGGATSGSTSGSNGGAIGSTGGDGSGGSGSGGSSQAQSQDGAPVPGTGSTTRGRALPPPPEDIEVRPLRAGERSSVLIKQPTGAAGARVLSTVVVVRNAEGKVISRLNVALKSGQGEIEVTVPYVAEGFTVDVYNVNEVGVSTGALIRSPLVRATTITKRTSTGKPRLFGEMLGEPIIFNGGSAKLDRRDKKQLRAIAREAKKSNERLFVTGFARKGGGSARELASLSTRRARAAATYLSKRGVRVWIRYWGAGTLNGTGQASDRRVEVRTSAAPIPRTLVP